MGEVWLWRGFSPLIPHNRGKIPCGGELQVGFNKGEKKKLEL